MASNAKILVWPSLLAGDFGRLEESALKAESAGADALHIDVMDGHFVPNLSMGPDVVKMARGRVKTPLSVHLMLTEPNRFVDIFAEAGASTLTIHVESSCDLLGTLRRIRAAGVKPGLALNPGTPAAAAEKYLGEIEILLCMTVHPGFGGQKFMPEVLPKITQIRSLADSLGIPLDIAVDGGIDAGNVRSVAAAGSNVFVSGSALFRAESMSAEIQKLKVLAGAAFPAKAPSAGVENIISRRT